jgi:nucleotide-binding universal stress UspA family protein
MTTAPFKRILCPIDTSRGAHAIRDLVQLADPMAAELHLLHVCKSARKGSQCEWPPESRTLLGPRRVAPRRMILSGTHADKIVDYADEINADLIVMPTRRRGVLSQVLFGSTTIEVLHRTSRPVWAMAYRSLSAARPFGCRRIVCGVDLGPEGQVVLRYAARLAATWQAELVIAHVVAGLSDAILMLYGLDEAGEIELLPETARQKVIGMAERLVVPYEVDVSIGDVAEGCTQPQSGTRLIS